MRAGRLWLVGVMMAVAGAAAAQAPAWPSPSYPDPLRFSSLPLNGVEATAPPEGRWQVVATSSYFNVWHLTWHTGTHHLGVGLGGQPLTRAEVDHLALAFPQDQFFHIDVEGKRFDLAASYGLPRGLAVTVQLPWIEIGRPHWDAIPERFHSAFGMGTMRRDIFPRGQTTVYVRGRHQTIERLDNRERGQGIGDVAVSLSGAAGTWLRASHRWVVSVEAPTGERDTYRGSGGWDAGVRWFAAWGSGRRQARVGLGYTYLDREGSWLGAHRADTWHVLVDLRHPLTRSMDWRLALRCDSSPLATFTDSRLGDPAFFWQAGLLVPLGGHAFAALDLGQNYPLSAHVPDFSLHLSFGTRL